MPVKIKVFAVVMAVMCLMSLTCVTAFAAETDLPPGAIVVGNGDAINTSDLTSLSKPYVIPAEGLETITIKGLFGFSSVYGWNGTEWVKLSVSNPADVTINVADYDYTYYTMLRGDTMASQTVTVSWVKASVLDKVITAVGTFVSTTLTAVGAPVLSFITSSPLTLVPALAGLVVLGVCIVRRFVYGA